MSSGAVTPSLVIPAFIAGIQSSGAVRLDPGNKSRDDGG